MYCFMFSFPIDETYDVSVSIRLDNDKANVYFIKVLRKKDDYMWKNLDLIYSC